MNPPDWPTAELTIPAQEKLPSRELTGDGIAAKISPVGLTLCYDIPSAQEVIDDSMEFVFLDGSSYTIKGDDLVNFAGLPQPGSEDAVLLLQPPVRYQGSHGASPPESLVCRGRAEKPHDRYCPALTLWAL